jgi:hypothetical protein
VLRVLLKANEAKRECGEFEVVSLLRLVVFTVIGAPCSDYMYFEKLMIFFLYTCMYIYGCLSVRAKNILGSYRMMAKLGKQHIGTYVTEPNLTNTQKHRTRAVVSLTKARNIFTNRTKK